jgi:hypothetical protein
MFQTLGLVTVNSIWFENMCLRRVAVVSYFYHTALESFQQEPLTLDQGQAGRAFHSLAMRKGYAINRHF